MRSKDSLQKHLDYLQEYHNLALNILTRLETEDTELVMKHLHRLEAMSELFPLMEKEFQALSPCSSESEIVERLEKQSQINRGLLQAIDQKCQSKKLALEEKLFRLSQSNKASHRNKSKAQRIQIET